MPQKRKLITTANVAATALLAVVPKVWRTMSAALPLRCMCVMRRSARAFVSPPDWSKNAIATRAVGITESMKYAVVAAPEFLLACM
jgi:hypothetical protein